jgi:hypothetical protein
MLFELPIVTRSHTAVQFCQTLRRAGRRQQHELLEMDACQMANKRSHRLEEETASATKPGELHIPPSARSTAQQGSNEQERYITTQGTAAIVPRCCFGAQLAACQRVVCSKCLLLEAR